VESTLQKFVSGKVSADGDNKLSTKDSKEPKATGLLVSLSLIPGTSDQVYLYIIEDLNTLWSKGLIT